MAAGGSSAITPRTERFVRDLVVDTGYTAVFVNYTPSPEAHYPTAINQAFAATKWVGQHGAEIGVDPSRIALVGNSVGGNMTAVVALKCKNNHGPGHQMPGHVLAGHRRQLRNRFLQHLC